MKLAVQYDAGGGRYFRGDPSGLAVRLYWPGDEWAVTPRDDFREAWEAEGRRLPQGSKWTLEERGKILAVGGFTLEIGPEGHAWAAWGLSADLTPRQWLFVAKVAGRLIRKLQEITPRWPVCAAAAAHPGAGRLLERMGLTPAGDPAEGVYQRKAA